MGQRLVINIEDENGETLANAYYHWSGYTNSAASTILDMFNNYDDLVKRYGYNKRILAIKMLEQTGAGITGEEREKLEDSEDEQKYAELRNINIQNCVSRDKGILSVLPEEIECSKAWGELMVWFNLDTEEMDLTQMYYETPIEEYKDNLGLDVNDELKLNDLDFYDAFIYSLVEGLGHINIRENKERFFDTLNSLATISGDYFSPNGVVGFIE